MSVKERLTEFLKVKQISKSEFARRIGVSNAYITSMRVSIQPEKAQRIALTFPELNMQWLLLGEGEMLNSKPAVEGVTPESPEKKKEVAGADAGMSERLLALVESQQQTIAQLTESNNRLARLLEGYKKVTTPAEAVGAVSSAVLP